MRPSRSSRSRARTTSATTPHRRGARWSSAADDGRRLRPVSRLHQLRPHQLEEVIGGTEDTTTGVIRLRAIGGGRVLRYPVVAVNDADTKHLFDNRHGRASPRSTALSGPRTSCLRQAVRRRRLRVFWQGSCSSGEGMGALVTVTEIDPLRALEAGPWTGSGSSRWRWPLARASLRDRHGQQAVLRAEHFAEMRDGAILANAGHFDVEIDLVGLEAMAEGRRRIVRPMVEEFTVAASGGAPRRILVLAEGRLVNLSAAEGHPAAVMDLSFRQPCARGRVVGSGPWQAVQPRLRSAKGCRRGDREAEARDDGDVIDELTESQRAYLASWTSGT